MEKEIIKNLLADMSECPLFIGKYDAKNGNEDFMYGIQTVMEFLAFSVSNNFGEEFSKKFTQNMVDSKKKK